MQGAGPVSVRPKKAVVRYRDTGLSEKVRTATTATAGSDGSTNTEMQTNFSRPILNFTSMIPAGVRQQFPKKSDVFLMSMTGTRKHTGKRAMCINISLHKAPI